MFTKIITVAVIGLAVGVSISATSARETVQEGMEQQNQSVQAIENFDAMIQSGQL